MGTSITYLTLSLEGNMDLPLTDFQMRINVGESKNTHASATFTSDILQKNFFLYLASKGEQGKGFFVNVNNDMPPEIDQAGGEQSFLTKNMHLLPVNVIGSRIENVYKYEKVAEADEYIKAKIERYNKEVQEVMDKKQDMFDHMADGIEKLEDLQLRIDSAVDKAGGEKVIKAIHNIFGGKSSKYYQEVILSYMKKKQCTVSEALDEVLKEVKKSYADIEKTSKKLKAYKISANPGDLLKELSKGNEELFRGYIDSVTVKKAEDGSSYILSGTLKSGTILLDQQIRSRSFQGEEMTYKSVIEEVVENIKTDLQKKAEPVFMRAMYHEAEINVTFDCAEADENYKDPELLEQTIKEPLIQYEETDWNFIRRIASRLRLGIVADANSWDPKFTVGIQKPQGTDSDAMIKDMQIIPNVYVSGFDQEYYKMGGRAAGYIKKSFFHITLLSLLNYLIGSQIDQVPTTVSKKTGTIGFWICGKDGEFSKKQNEMQFRYLMAMPAYVTLRRIPFSLPGKEKTIQGEVLERKDQNIKILLQIDNDDKRIRSEPPIDKAAYKEKAFWYKWAPETGNTMYSMPTVGTQVALYFPDDDEQNAFAVHCVRQEESQTCDGLQTYTDRWFTSEFQQKMLLHPNSIGLISTGNPLHIIQSDSGGIEIASDGDINLTASGQIGINAPSITLAGKNMNVGS